MHTLCQTARKGDFVAEGSSDNEPEKSSDGEGLGICLHRHPENGLFLVDLSLVDYLESVLRRPVKNRRVLVRAVEVSVKSFVACVVRMGDGKGRLKLEQSEFVVDEEKVFDAIIRLCFKRVGKCLIQLLHPLKRKKGRTSQKRAPKKRESTHFKHWHKYGALSKLYLSAVQIFLSEVESDQVLLATLRVVTDLADLFLHFPKLCKMLMKFLVHFWSRKTEELRCLAFVALCKMVRLDPECFPAVYKSCYTAYVANCKVVEEETLPFIHFMQCSLAELTFVHPTQAYQYAFVYIRQFAIHLRNAMIAKRKDLIQTVYNWQFVKGLQLWVLIVCEGSKRFRPSTPIDESGGGNWFTELIHPLVEIINSLWRLFPSAKFFPLRLHAIRMLLNIQRESEVFVPSLAFAVELLEELAQIDAKKPTAGKGRTRDPNIERMLRLSGEQLDDAGVRAHLAQQLFELIAECLRLVHSREGAAAASITAPISVRLKFLYLTVVISPKFVNEIFGKMAPPPTFFVTDRQMLRHKCEWDVDHIEKPERLSSLLDTIEGDAALLSQCTQLTPSECPLEDILLVHSPQHVESLRNASSLPNLEAMEQFCSQHEDIYVNKSSWECALLSAGCAVTATETVIRTSKERKELISESAAPNAFVAIRPPGHHASRDNPCGFCLLNNVAICAKKARSLGIERVLIVDWDVHAAQGTQYCASEDPEGILLLSIHRFERGTFWPELPESAIVHQYPNTINAPLNSTGYGDAEYAAFFHFIVLPLIYQWRPGLILVSCGFDAAIGDPQGGMEVSPACFGYMTGLLAQQGVPLCLILEGGYFLLSVCQGALQCVRALVQRSPTIRHFCRKNPSSDFARTLLTIHFVLRNKWPLFAGWIQLVNALRAKQKLQLVNMPEAAEYIGTRQKQLEVPQPTRGQYPPREKGVEWAFEQRIKTLLHQYTNREELKREQIGLVIGMDEKKCPTLTLEIPDRAATIFPLSGPTHFEILYFFVLLPLAFYEADIRTTHGTMLPFALSEMETLAGQIGYKEQFAGIIDQLQENLEVITKIFPKFELNTLM